MKRWMLAAAAVTAALILVIHREPPQTLISTSVAPATPDRKHPAAAVTALPATVPAAKPSPPAAMQQAITQVALAYEQAAAYPPYSTPLSAAQTELLQPNAGAVSRRDLNSFGLPGRMTVSLNAYRYRPGDTIHAQVMLYGDHNLFTQVARLSLTLSDAHNQPLQTLPAQATVSDGQQRWDVSVRAAEDWPEELNLTATLILTDGEQLQQSAPLRLFTSVAEITALGKPYRDNNELVIPVELEQAQPGYYKLAASLHYEDKKPLAYLQGTARISHSGTLELRVYGALLTQLPATQDLWLGNFRLRRIPAKPADNDNLGWGSSRQDFFRIKQINPTHFSASPYQDAQAAQRLQFLQSLGQAEALSGTR